MEAVPFPQNLLTQSGTLLVAFLSLARQMTAMGRSAASLPPLTGGHAHNWDPIYQVDSGISPAHRAPHLRPHVSPFTAQPEGNTETRPLSSLVISECFLLALGGLMETCAGTGGLRSQRGESIRCGSVLRPGLGTKRNFEVIWAWEPVSPESRPELCDLWQATSYLSVPPLPNLSPGL